jgi:hypothetical protein
VQGELRLAGHDGCGSGRRRDDADERAVAGCRAACRRDGPVEVRGDPRQSTAYGDGALGQQLPADLRGEPLHDRRRLVVGRAHRAQAQLGQRDVQPLTTDHQDARVGRDQLGDQPGSGLGGGDHVIGVREHAEVAQVCRDGCRGPVGVVGDERDAHAERFGAGQRLRSAGHHVGSDVDDPVEVDECGVVSRCEGLGGTVREPHGFCSRKRSVARASRNACS